MGHLQVVTGGAASSATRQVQQVRCTVERSGRVAVPVDSVDVTVHDLVLTMSDDGLLLATPMTCPTIVTGPRVDVTGSPAV